MSDTSFIAQRIAAGTPDRRRLDAAGYVADAAGRQAGEYPRDDGKVLYATGTLGGSRSTATPPTAQGQAIGTPGFAFNEVFLELFPASRAAPVRTVRVRVRDNSAGATFNGAVLAEIWEGVNPIHGRGSRFRIDLGQTVANGAVWVEYATDGQLAQRKTVTAGTAGTFITGTLFSVPNSNYGTPTTTSWMGVGTGGTASLQTNPSGMVAASVLNNITTGASGWSFPLGVLTAFNRLTVLIQPCSNASIPQHARMKILDGFGGAVLADKTVRLPLLDAGSPYALTVQFDKAISPTGNNLRLQLYTDGEIGYMGSASTDYGSEHIRQLQTDGGIEDNGTWADAGSNGGIFFQAKLVSSQPPAVFSPAALDTAARKAVFDFYRPSVQLPSMINAVVGKETAVYFPNIVRRLFTDADTNYADYSYRVTALRSTTALGTQQGGATIPRWVYTPVSGDVGDQSFKLDVFYAGQLVASRTSTLRAKAATTSAVSRKVLTIGNSLTNAGLFLAELVNLCTGSGLTVTTVGTRSTTCNDAGSVSRTVNHEGRGGWTAALYYNQATDSTATYTNAFRNPGTGLFDLSYYLAQNPSITLASSDWVLVELGINESDFLLSDAARATMLTLEKTYLDTIIASIKAAVSGVRVGLLLPSLPALSQDAAAVSFGQTVNRERAFRNLSLYRDWLTQIYDTAANVTAKTWVFEFGGHLDLQNNMQTTSSALNAYNATTVNRQSDGLHPANSGYYQLGAAVYCALRGQEA
jgi:lysophospholipase L1-like esterase